MANTRKFKVILFDQEYPASTELRRRRMELWREGITAAGDEVEFVNQDPKQFGDLCITWGPRTIALAHQKALHHLVMECGFLGDRLDNFFVGYSGLNGSGVCPIKPVAGAGAEWYPLIKPLPKRKQHKNLVIFGQVAKDANLMPLGINDGEERIAAYRSYLLKVARLFERKGLAVGFRGHPKDPVWTNTVRPDVFSFDEAGWEKDRIFEWADIAFAFSSNSLVEAYLEGLDVIPAHPASLCWDVRSVVDGQNWLPEEKRRRWVDMVAANQWSSEDIRTGKAWDTIKPFFARSCKL